MKLELKHITPYLPYGLKYVKIKNNEVETMRSISTEINLIDMGWGDAMQLDEIKPILRPLSDLTKEEFVMDGWRKKGILFLDETSNIPHNSRESHIGSIMYGDMVKIFEWHLDVFGLIEKGLAININTIK